MHKVFITRTIPKAGIDLLASQGYEMVINPSDGILTHNELIEQIEDKGYEAVLCLLTDKIDGEVIEASQPTVKIFANYAVGFDNIDVEAAKQKGVMVTNTPDVLTDTVAEHTFALMLAIAHRITEADKFVRAGKYQGWSPMLLLGNDVSGKTLGVIGCGRIGSRVVHHAVNGFGMKVIYHDIKRNEELEKKYKALYVTTLDELLKKADFVSVHVPLMPETRHLLGRAQFKIMKPTAYLINTARGPIIDEAALVNALQNENIKGAALDVFENEPTITPELFKLDNVILTPHIASATEETRAKMSELAARNIIEALEGRTPPNLLK